MSDPTETNSPSPGPPTNQTSGPSGAEDSATAENSATSATKVLKTAEAQCRALYTDNTKAENWTTVAQTVEKYSDKTIKRWIEEIDTYLVFAGLFSAILTAFNVPAYTLLNPPDPSIALLQQISSKLDSFSINHSFINSTRPSSTNSPNADIEPPILRWAVALNGLWFSGLILSLTSASMGLMSKQWLNECSGGISKTSRHAARMRQYRLENLKAWHVATIVNMIPILLQLSLACFLSGLLIFLWNLHHTIAAIASALVGFLVIIFIATTLLPLWKPGCAYLSPQTRALYYLCKQPERFAYWVCATLATLCCGTAGDTHSTVSQESSSSNLHPCFKSWKAPTLTWKRREWSRIDELKDDLDVKILCEAYRITLHPKTLFSVSVCLTSLAAEDVVGCFQLFHKYAQEHFGPTADDHLKIWGQQKTLWLRVTLDASLASHTQSVRLDADEAAALRLYLESGSWSSSMQAAEVEWALSTLDALTDYHENEGSGGLTGDSIDQLHRLRMERGKLLETAIGREEPLTNIVLLVICRTYCRVSREHRQLPLTAKAAHTSYLRSVWHHFLELANRALILCNRPIDLEAVRLCTQVVITKLTDALLELFTRGQVQTTIESTYLHKVMETLRDLDDIRVERCISDELVPKISDLASRLAGFDDYYDNHWAGDIQRSARALKANVDRVKCKHGAV